jgi:hypothetical protein
MKVPGHPTLIRRMLDARVKRLCARGPVLLASPVEIAKHCGRPRCRCQRGFKHVGHYLTFKRAGKTVYVPLDEDRKQDCELKALLLQAVEQGSLLGRLAARHDRTPICYSAKRRFAAKHEGLFGSLKSIARRRLECFRNRQLPDEAFALRPTIRVRLDRSWSEVL